MRDYNKLGSKAHGKSKSALWVVALAAFYCENQAEYARLLMVNRSTVHRWASAYTAYKFLKECCNVQHIRTLRKKLSVSHFAKLYKLWIMYEFSPQQALDYLELAADNEWSTEKLSVEIVGTETNPDLFGDYRRFTGKLMEWALKLRNGFVPHGLPDDMRQRALYLADDVETLARDVEAVRCRMT